jgi:hypothetical protein
MSHTDRGVSMVGAKNRGVQISDYRFHIPDRKPGTDRVPSFLSFYGLVSGI